MAAVAVGVWSRRPEGMNSLFFFMPPSKVNCAKFLEMKSFFFNWNTFLELGKTQDLPSKIWQNSWGCS
jgi:hypothetical protein